MNGVHNCPVRLEDIKVAEDIFGPDMAVLKGKSTRPRPKAVLQDWGEIPPEISYKHRRVELCIDLMYINRVGLMTSIDRSIHYRAVVPIFSKTPKELSRALCQVIDHYNKAGYYVSMVFCDRE